MACNYTSFQSSCSFQDAISCWYNPLMVLLCGELNELVYYPCYMCKAIRTVQVRMLQLRVCVALTAQLRMFQLAHISLSGSFVAV